MRNLPVCVVGLLVAGSAFAVAPSHPIEMDYPKSGEAIAADAKEVTLRWHIDQKKVPAWQVAVWCASDGEKLFAGDVKTNELTVTGLRPNRVYYWRVARSWARIGESTFSTGEVAAPDAKPLPEEFRDPARYDLVGMPGGKAFDVGLTRFRGWTRVKVDRASKTEFSVCVPCEEYARAYVLCSVDPDPKKDKAFNLRLTRHVNGPWRKYLGRAPQAMANALVELKDNPGRDLGNGLRLVEVPINTGDIQDIVFTDERGDFIKERGRYLDLEVMGRIYTWRTSTRDRRSDTDPDYTSAVTVYGIALEKPSAEMEVKTVRPGNVFANAEKPEGLAEIRIRKPGAYTLRVMTEDVDGRTLGVNEQPVAASGTVRIGFPQDGEGWYGLTWELLDAGRVIVTHHASFAMLGADTRTTEIGEQYGTWPCLSRWGSHYAPKLDDTNAVEAVMEVLYKAGFRRAFGMADLPYETRKRWKIGDSVVARFPQDWSYVKKGGETNLVAVIRQRLAENPNCKVAMIFHEHAPIGGPAPEIFGLEPREKHLKQGKKQAEEANRYGAFMRKHFPEVKILVGNSLVCGEFVAELIRNGFKEEYADYMGLEVMGNEVLPELQHPLTMQAAELMQLVAKRFGYTKWGVDQCFESNFRQDAVIGAEEQASYYVRDILLSYVWGFPNVYIGGLTDCANQYEMSAWGNDGFCTRYPYLYPKRSYVAVATATKFLDRVTGVRKIPTGDECVYAVEFTRQDGKAVTAFWTSRGEVEMRVETDGAVEMIDMYGRANKFGRDGARPSPDMAGGMRSVASKRVQYVVGAPGCVKGVSVVKRAFPDDVPPADYRVVATTADASAWTVADKVIPSVENNFVARGWPHRSFAEGVMRQVDDPEAGKVIELEIPDDGRSVADPHFRYTALMLKKPVPVGRNFHSLGCTVKGNSGWGEIYYVLEDAKGRRTVSCDIGAQGKLDREGRSVLSFTGWNFLRFALKPGSSVHELSTNRPLWNWTDTRVAQADGLRLAGLVFSARMRPLFLNEAKPCRQVIRIKDIGVFDEHEVQGSEFKEAE